MLTVSHRILVEFLNMLHLVEKYSTQSRDEEM